jgi:hypothetical protein
MIPCIVVDMSDGGARIEAKYPETLPEEFSLVFIEDSVRPHRCHLMWRSGTHVGVSFFEDDSE